MASSDDGFATRLVSAVEVSVELLVGVLFAIQWAVNLLLALLILGAYHHMSRAHTQARDQALPASHLKKGDLFPIDLALALPTNVVLLIVSHGCSGCVDLCSKLTAVDLGGWSLVVMISGPLTQPDVAANGLPLTPGARPEPMPVPAYATTVHDRDREWFNKLGSRVYPTAIALIDGRVADQRVGPGVDWFLNLDQDARDARGTFERSSTAYKTRSGPTPNSSLEAG